MSSSVIAFRVDPTSISAGEASPRERSAATRDSCVEYLRLNRCRPGWSSPLIPPVDHPQPLLRRPTDTGPVRQHPELDNSHYEE